MSYTRTQIKKCYEDALFERAGEHTKQLAYLVAKMEQQHQEIMALLKDRHGPCKEEIEKLKKTIENMREFYELKVQQHIRMKEEIKQLKKQQLVAIVE